MTRIIDVGLVMPSKVPEDATVEPRILTPDEVAERMGRSRPAAQMLWMRAIRKLQEVLEQGGPADGDH